MPSIGRVPARKLCEVRAHRRVIVAASNNFGQVAWQPTGRRHANSAGRTHPALFDQGVRHISIDKAWFIARRSAQDHIPDFRPFRFTLRSVNVQGYDIFAGFFILVDGMLFY